MKGARSENQAEFLFGGTRSTGGRCYFVNREYKYSYLKLADGYSHKGAYCSTVRASRPRALDERSTISDGWASGPDPLSSKYDDWPSGWETVAVL